jgi:hypothetical protein
MFNLVKKKSQVAKTKSQLRKGTRGAKKATKKKIGSVESLLRQGFGCNSVRELAKIGFLIPATCLLAIFPFA